MAELRCEHVAASYGSRTVLHDVDIVVPEGTLTAVLGASGSGKTTLLRVVMGFTRAEQGRVVVGGTVVADGRTHLPPEKRGVGYVAQEGALYPHLDVGENVAFGLPRSERRPRRVSARSWSWSASAASTRTAARTSCRGENSAGCRWRGRSRRDPAWSSSTSPSPGSTPPCGSRPEPRCCRHSPTRRRPRCS